MKTLTLLILVGGIQGLLYNANAAEQSIDKTNLVRNGDFHNGEMGQLPDGWDIITPNKVLAPRFELRKGANQKHALMAAGNGRLECFGYARYPVKLEANKS